MADLLALQARRVFLAEDIAAPGVRVFPIPDMALASIAVRAGKSAELTERIQAHFDFALPTGPTHVAAGDVSVLGAGPGAWLAVSADPTLADRLREVCDGVAAVADQSGAYGVLALEGPGVRDLLARFVAIDLHNRAFPENAAAILALSHFGGALWRLPGAHRFRLAVSRSTAADLGRLLRHAADSLTAGG